MDAYPDVSELFERIKMFFTKRLENPFEVLYNESIKFHKRRAKKW